MKIERILAGIDFGPYSEIVEAYLLLFAKEMGASVFLVHVIDYLVTPPAYLATYLEEEKGVSEKKFTVIERRFLDAGIKTESEVVVGRLGESFERVVEKIDADMLILGFKSHPLRRSSSEKLIKGLQMPMLVVRGEKAESASTGSVKIRRILCPTDLSDTSRRSLEVAKDLKNIFSSRIDVVHVFPGYVIRDKIETLTDRDKAMQDLIEQSKGRLDRFLSDSGMKEPGVIDEGKPDKRIISFAKKEDVDLIVMGARGLGFIKGMIIGSVTDAVLKSSPCPVLVVH
jgi:nucleotide-binding universal stress UspA family protein